MPHFLQSLDPIDVITTTDEIGHARQCHELNLGLDVIVCLLQVLIVYVGLTTDKIGHVTGQCHES